jgi:C4-dicarboxylate-specific signal transduction histidine kinase
MKIILQKKKLVLWLCVVFILLFTGFVVLLFYTQKRMLINSHNESLQILANEKALLANTFLESQKEKLEIIASMNVFKQAVLYPNDPAIIATAKDRINEIKDKVPRIAIFTSEGIMFIAESGPVPIDYSAIPYFVSKDKKIILMSYYDKFQKRDYYSVLGPIYDSIVKNKVIGAIAFDVELDKISALMKETIENKNKEVYLINGTGLLLSSSEYIGINNKNGVLIQEVKSNGAKDCLEDLKKYKKDGAIEEHKDKVGQYINYMGDEVFGAIAHVPSIMGCVIAEESAKEVLGIYDVKLY